MMSTFNEDLLEKRLLGLKDTHESISGTSHWCLEQPQHHKKIVAVWLQVLKQVKVEQRLTLFHLANDVIQYSKRKGYEFAESWGPALQKATTMVREEKVRKKILRIFRIWEERGIYDEAFLSDLSGLLSSHTSSQSTQDAQDFQPSILITKIRSCKALEDDTDLKRKIVNDSHLSLNDADALHSALKDRRHGADLEEELEEGVLKMESFIEALKTEISDRNALIEQLDLGEAFYEIQRGEAKVVCNAYRNFSKRVDVLKKKLDELTDSLPSPVPSPDINAPSPSPESDIDLPDEPIAGSFSVASSFIGAIDPEQIQQLAKSDEIFSLLDSPRDGISPPRKIKYKPPTPPRNFKRKMISPKSYSPVPTYISSATPTLSSSSASNYSPTPYPVTKANVYTPPPTTTAYTIPAVTTYAQNSGYSATSTYAQNDSYSYDPEENDDMNPLFSNNSSDSYHVPGANPPPPTQYPASPSDYHNPPLPSYQNPPPPLNYDNPPAPTDYGYSNPYESRPSSYLNPPPPAVPVNDFSVPPPPADFSAPPRPFYSSNNELPPLLGEDCPPPPINGFDAFLKGNSSSPNATSPVGFSSFVGNMNLPFDFQKGLFSDDTPSSPPPVNLIDDSTSQLDAYFSNDSNNDAEGKPIEVINRTKQPDLSDILKVITMRSEAVPPPPQPPPIAPDISTPPPPMLPPKFPTWGQSDWSDTPASPPLYEKSGFVEPVEFDETDGDGLILGADTDLRSLGLPGDIDHRNLISLTSSPRDTEPCFPSSQDTDYRKMALAPKKTTTDIVESIDMEMSSEEEADPETTKPTTSVSFSLSSNNKKTLGISPLKEKEEPMKKLSVPVSPPQRLPEPPPLPNVDDIFPELDSGDDNKEPPERIPSPPKPPMPLFSPTNSVQSIPAVQNTRPPPAANFNQQFHSPRPHRGVFNQNQSQRFNSPRQRFNQPWHNNPRNQNSPRQRPSPMVGPRFRPDGFRGRSPWFPRGNQRPPRFTGW